jgi:deazaflavin-dependent oxidoreductase (nitroreductase family)
MRLRRRLTSTGNRFGVWLYRRFDGRLSSPPGATVLLITSPGRRSGVPRSTCVRYLDVPGGYLVWGTASGAPRDPDWFRNLRASEEADVQVGGRTVHVRRRELLGEERDGAWHDVVLARVPAVARYERKGGRTIPVAVLTPTGQDAPARDRA